MLGLSSCNELKLVVTNCILFKFNARASVKFRMVFCNRLFLILIGYLVCLCLKLALLLVNLIRQTNFACKQYF